MDLLGYIKGNRKGKEARRMELEAMRDTLLADALEGLDSVPGDHEEVIRQLRARISHRSSVRPVHVRRKHRPFSAIVASVLLIFSVGGSYLLFRSLDDTTYNIVAQLNDNDLYLEIDGIQVLSKKKSFPQSDIVCDYKPDIFTDRTIPNIVLPAVVVTAYKRGILPFNNLREQVSEELQYAQDVAIYEVSELDDSNDLAIAIRKEIGNKNAEESKVMACNEESKSVDIYDSATKQPVTKGYSSSKKAIRLDVAAVDSIIEKKLITSLDDFYKYVSLNKRTIKDSEGNDIKGETEVEFKIDSKGHPYDLRILKSIGAVADTELKRLINDSPLWLPTTEKQTVQIVF